MAQTLGEKLREAREERGLSVGEIAEQTRISPHYIDSIERDDYKPLPGGIFNKGFVKSFAKSVGINEQEAVADYTRQATASDIALVDEQKLYKPEVLTDDNSGKSMLPTIITAVVILGAMTGLILFGLSYLNSDGTTPTPTVANTNSSKQNSNTATTTPAADPSAPTMASLKVEIKAINAPVPVSATTDGAKSENTIGAGSSQLYEPKDSLTINYNKWNADKVQMTINGKTIALPATPLKPADKRIEFTINKDNIAQIWSSGTVSTEVPAVSATTNTTTPATPTVTAAAPTTLRPTPATKPSVPAAANPTPQPPAATPRPAATTAPAANRP
jgi:cytoskeletal protein RodZ